MAEYRFTRTDQEIRTVCLEELFNVFGIRARVADYDLDSWLAGKGFFSDTSMAEVPDDVLVEYLEDQRRLEEGGNNPRRTAYQEYKDTITLAQDERPAAARLLRELAKERRPDTGSWW